MSDQFIQKLFTSRDNNITSDQFVGNQDRLWYDPVSNTLRVWTGNPGGKAVGGGGGSGTANIAVSNQSILITPVVSSFNFIGSGVVATAIGNAVTVDVPGAGYISFDGGSPTNYYGGGPAFDCGGVY